MIGRIKDLLFTEEGTDIIFATKGSIEELEGITHETTVEVKIKPYRQKRSLDANAYFHLLVNKMAGMLRTSETEMKIKMNLRYGTVAEKDGVMCGVKVPRNTDIQSFYPYAKWIGEVEDNGKMFDKYLFYKRTSELDTKEMSVLIDGVVSECKELGIETATPQELERMMKEWDK